MSLAIEVSPAMSKERQALDVYPKKMIGFERKVTSHSEEVFVLNI